MPTHLLPPVWPMTAPAYSGAESSSPVNAKMTTVSSISMGTDFFPPGGMRCTTVSPFTVMRCGAFPVFV